MNKVKKTTLKDRIRDAVRAFQGKPKDTIDVGVRVNRCSECKTREVKTFRASIDRYISTESLVVEEMDKMFETECALELLRNLRASGAIHFIKGARAGSRPGVRELNYIACIDVVISEEEAEQNDG